MLYCVYRNGSVMLGGQEFEVYNQRYIQNFGICKKYGFGSFE